MAGAGSGDTGRQNANDSGFLGGSTGSARDLNCCATRGLLAGGGIPRVVYGRALLPSARSYERRRPEKTPLHKIVSEHLESWLKWCDQAERPVPGYVEEELRGYLECGIPCLLADRSGAVATLTKVFLAEIERLLSAMTDVTIDAAAPAAARPRLGAISFLHRFGSALNHHVHLHVCTTDGVFMPAAGGAGCCAPSAFLPARPITQADLATVTERVRRRLIRWFGLAHLLATSAAAHMLAWENSGFSIVAFRADRDHRLRRAELLSELGPPAAVLCAAALCARTALRDA